MSTFKPRNDMERRFAEAQAIPGWSARMDAQAILVVEDADAYTEAARRYRAWEVRNKAVPEPRPEPLFTMTREWAILIGWTIVATAVWFALGYILDRASVWSMPWWLGFLPMYLVTIYVVGGYLLIVGVMRWWGRRP